MPVSAANAAPAASVNRTGECSLPFDDVALRATPAAHPGATPEALKAAATPARTTGGATPVAATHSEPPADQEQARLTRELGAVADALASCLTAGDAHGVADLVTDNWIGAWFGAEQMTREQFIQLSTGLGWLPVEIRSLSAVKSTGPDSASAVVEYLIGHQLSRSEWSFVRRSPKDAVPGAIDWSVNGEKPLLASAPTNSAEINVNISEGSFSVDTPTVDTGNVVLHGINAGTDNHEMVVLRFEGDYTLEDLLRANGPGLPDQSEWIGQITLAPVREDRMVLVDLDPGVYWVLCLLPNPDGTPHAALQEAASFTVK